jgi:hypothetical protein
MNTPPIVSPEEWEMMLPGAAPAVCNRAHASGRARTMPLFLGSYLAVCVRGAKHCE